MAEQAPWEMDWGAQAAPEVQIPAGELLPWEMDWEAATLEESRGRQDQILQDLGEAPMMAASRESQDAMLNRVEEDAAAQRSMLEQIFARQGANIAEAPMMEQSRELQDQYLSEIEEQRRILAELVAATSGGTARRMQDLAEQQMMQRSRDRQDKVLAEILRRRGARRVRKPVVDHEAQLRELAKEEHAVGVRAAKASDRGDRKSHDAAVQELDRLFGHREKLFGAIKKANPKRAIQLYDELYLGR